MSCFVHLTMKCDDITGHRTDTKRMARSSVRHHRSLMDVKVGEIHITPCLAIHDTL